MWIKIIGFFVSRIYPVGHFGTSTNVTIDHSSKTIEKSTQILKPIKNCPPPCTSYNNYMDGRGAILSRWRPTRRRKIDGFLDFRYRKICFFWNFKDFEIFRIFFFHVRKKNFFDDKKKLSNFLDHYIALKFSEESIFSHPRSDLTSLSTPNLLG